MMVMKKMMMMMMVRGGVSYSKYFMSNLLSINKHVDVITILEFEEEEHRGCISEGESMKQDIDVDFESNDYFYDDDVEAMTFYSDDEDFDGDEPWRRVGDGVQEEAREEVNECAKTTNKADGSSSSREEVKECAKTTNEADGSSGISGTYVHELLSHTKPCNSCESTKEKLSRLTDTEAAQRALRLDASSKLFVS